ncbi:MAG: response regulator [Ignavibacteriae bacterium]|nr:response regulator [Ignavibacteriota bacterium]
MSSQRIGRLLLTAALLLCLSESDASTRVDSLTALLSQNLSDSVRISLLNELTTEQLHLMHLNAARAYASEALSLSVKTGNTYGAAMSYRVLGRIFRIRGPLNLQLENFIKSLELFRSLRNQGETAEALRLLGMAYTSGSEYPKAKEYLEEAKALFERLHDVAGVRKTTVRYAVVLGFAGQTANAIELLKQVLQSDTLGMRETKATAYSYLGFFSFKYGNVSAAIAYLRQCLAVSLHLGNPFLVADAKADLGSYLIADGKYDEAISMLQEARTAFTLIGTVVYELNALEQLAHAFAGKGDYRSAWQATEQALALQEILDRQRKAEHIAAAQLEFQMQKRELQTKLIQQESDDNRRLAIVVITASVVLIAFMILRHQSNKRANALLAAKNATIQHHQEELERNVAELERTEAELDITNKTLQQSVLERTSELRATNEELQRQIDTRKQLEQQLIHAQKMESIGTLAGGIAHDFNNILSIVLAHASFLTPDKPDQVLQRKEAITVATDRAAALVRQLLTFARKTEADAECVEVNEILEELHRLLVETFPKIISIQRELADGLPYIGGDKSQVHQALLNLCVNARDAMPNGGSLTLRTTLVDAERITHKFPDARSESYVLISVIDTGIGMDEKTKQRIFEPFFTTKGIGRGTGLGLSVTYGVVVAHRGFIDVESAPGAGTAFHLYIPCLSQGHALPAHDIPALEHSVGGSETILIVEDEPDLASTLELVLATNGYHVLTATDGLEAIEIFRERADGIDLVISDIGLPKLDGWEAYKAIRAIAPRQRVIFASGYFDPEKRSEMMELGLKHFVPKPYHAQKILHEIRVALDDTKVANNPTA